MRFSIFSPRLRRLGSKNIENLISVLSVGKKTYFALGTKLLFSPPFFSTGGTGETEKGDGRDTETERERGIESYVLQSQNQSITSI